MERITAFKDSRNAIDDASTAKNYPERVLELPDAPLILRSASAATSVSDSAALITPVLVTPVTVAPTHVNPRHVGGFIRVLDLAVAGSIFLFVLPLMLLCALATSFTGPGPVIYRQLRVGHCGREFTCFKFRTMIHSAHASINSLLVDGSALQEEWKAIYKLRADPRVTWFGRFMRRYSLDELPQLFNVFIGDMSIVGPRPIVADEIERYGDRFADYCSVKPGITGLWQVSGRHSLSYEERVRLDSEYAQNKSVRLDLLILWKTIPVVLYGQNE